MADAMRDVSDGVGSGAERVQNGAVSGQLEGKFALVFVPFYPLARQYSHWISLDFYMMLDDFLDGFVFLFAYP